MASDFFDVIVVGAGPAGSTCAAFCASAGLRTLIIERAQFPREKVCGDCINPSCWPVLERLQLADRVLALPHSKLAELEFIGIGGRSIKFPLGASSRGEIAVKRSLFDQLLLDRAVECGAEARQGIAVASVADLDHGWCVRAGGEVFESKILVAADGRNSTVARLLGLLPRAAKDRVAIQTHLPAPAGFGARIVLRFLREGYCGLASVGDGLLNLCLVSTPDRIVNLKAWAEKQFALPCLQSWRTITPLARAAATSHAADLFLVGDAARVVEPFTGEGIFYALATGELAARHIAGRLPLRDFQRAQASLYRGRLWVNQISKLAALNPRAATAALELCRWNPRALRFLTGKVVGAALRS